MKAIGNKILSSKNVTHAKALEKVLTVKLSMSHESLKILRKSIKINCQFLI